MPQSIAENRTPKITHRLDQRRDVPVKGPITRLANLNGTIDSVHPIVGVRSKLPLDVGDETLLEGIETVADSLCI